MKVYLPKLVTIDDATRIGTGQFQFERISDGKYSALVTSRANIDNGPTPFQWGSIEPDENQSVNIFARSIVDLESATERTGKNVVRIMSKCTETLPGSAPNGPKDNVSAHIVLSLPEHIARVIRARAYVGGVQNACVITPDQALSTYVLNSLMLQRVIAGSINALTLQPDLFYPRTAEVGLSDTFGLLDPLTRGIYGQRPY